MKLKQFFLLVVLAVCMGSPVVAPTLFAQQKAKEEQASVICVRCVDPRYCEVKYLEKLPRGYTHTAIGCSKSLLENQAVLDALFYDIKRIKELDPSAKKLVLIDHTQCKEYGKLDSPEAHRANLKKIATVLSQDPRCLHLQIELKLHNMSTNKLEPVSLK